MRSLELRVKETFDLAKKSSESQIEGELALQEVNKIMPFIGEKFDVYEQERRQMKKAIEEVNGTVSKMNERTEKLESKIDRQEWYSKRNCMIAENKEEKIDQLAVDFIIDNLDIKMDDINIDRCNARGKVFRVKQKLKVQEKVLPKTLQHKRFAS